MEITGMLLIGSSALSGLMAIGLFAISHKIFSEISHLHISYFDDMSHEKLREISSNVREIRVVKHQKKSPLLNYHNRNRIHLSHVEIHHKDGSIARIHPKTHYEREALQNKILTVESKLQYHSLPNIIWTDIIKQ